MFTRSDDYENKQLNQVLFSVKHKYKIFLYLIVTFNIGQKGKHILNCLMTNRILNNSQKLQNINKIEEKVNIYLL